MLWSCAKLNITHHELLNMAVQRLTIAGALHPCCAAAPATLPDTTRWTLNCCTVWSGACPKWTARRSPETCCRPFRLTSMRCDVCSIIFFVRLVLRRSLCCCCACLLCLCRMFTIPVAGPICHHGATANPHKPRDPGVSPSVQRTPLNDGAKPRRPRCRGVGRMSTGSLPWCLHVFCSPQRRRRCRALCRQTVRHNETFARVHSGWELTCTKQIKKSHVVRHHHRATP